MADILIRGIEMPRDCPMCKLAHFNKFDNFTGCDAVPGKRYVPRSDDKFWNSAERPEWCPLVQLPAWHSRLIDADAVTQEAYRCLLECEKYGNEFQKPYEVIGAIETAKTIVPAEGDDTK